MTFSKGQEITIFNINGLAMTNQYKAKVKEDRGDSVEFILKGKRKRYTMKKSEMYIVLNGWDNPIYADTEVGSVMRGNACINLVSYLNIAEIRILLKQRAINEITEDTKGRILHFTLAQSEDSQYNETIDNIVYPEVEIYHAVINDAKQRGLENPV